MFPAPKAKIEKVCSISQRQGMAFFKPFKYFMAIVYNSYRSAIRWRYNLLNMRRNLCNGCFSILGAKPETHPFPLFVLSLACSRVGSSEPVCHSIICTLTTDMPPAPSVSSILQFSRKCLALYQDIRFIRCLHQL